MGMVSVIVPAYNEGERIGKAIDVLYQLCKKMRQPFEIIVGDDGSTDSQKEVVLRRMKRCKQLKFVSNSVNMGKGAILKKAFKKAKGDVQLFIDADLSIDSSLIPKMASLIESNNADVVIASKHAPGAKVNYSFARKLLSKGFSILTSILLSSKIKDFQCGLKAFRKEVVVDLIDKVEGGGWLWDTELVARAQKSGYRIVELPAVVDERGAQSKLRPIKDTISMFTGLMRLRRRIK